MRKVLIVVLGIALLGACKDKSEPEFDQAPLLENLGDHIIAPAYASFSIEIEELKTATNTFVSSTSFDNLNDLRTQLRVTYISFQNVKMFDFGPATDIKFKAAINTYPTDPEKINFNISSGEYTLGSAGNTDAVGLPAMDYLLHSGTDTEVLNRFNVGEDAENAKDYLVALVDKMSSEINLVNNQWAGAYKTTFKNTEGTDVGSSISLMFNELVKDLELVKNAKIGIPAGQFSGGELFPEYVEAVYATYSKELALENLRALKNLFEGGAGLGLDDYINFVEENESVTVTAAQISEQFDLCIQKVTELGDPFSENIPSDTSSFLAAFQELKKLVAYFKTDVPMALGVLINFSDTDGD